MALPYTIVLSIVGLLGIIYLVEPMTAWFYEAGWIVEHTGAAVESAISSGH
jgi:NhaB family Na+:H+ antiporter